MFTTSITPIRPWPPQENVALKSLMKSDDLIIKTADKDGGIVIQDCANYIQEANR